MDNLKEDVNGRVSTGGDEPVRVVLQLDDASHGIATAVVRRVARRWYWVASWTALFGIIGLLGTFLLTPKYDAEVTLSHVRSDASASALSGLVDQAGAIGALAGLGLITDDQLRSEDLAVLRSRAFTQVFIKERDLLPILFASDWDQQRQRWRPEDPEDIPDLNDAYEFFDEDVRYFQEDRKTGILKLVVRWDDPELAADWANDLIQRVNAYIRERAIADARKNIEYLNAQLQRTESVEIRASLFRLLENETKSAMIATVREEFAFRVLDPAQVSARDDYDFPNRLLISFLLACLGAVAGLVHASTFRRAS